MTTHSGIHVPGKPHGQKSLLGYSPLGHKEPDTHTHTHTHTRKALFGSILGFSPSKYATVPVAVYKIQFAATH